MDRPAQHGIKRGVLFVSFILIFVLVAVFCGLYWCLVPAATIVLFNIMVGMVHRQIVRRLLKKDGYRLVSFCENRGVFVTWSYSWPWWQELYEWKVGFESPSRHQFSATFQLLGPAFAMFYPRVSCCMTINPDEGDDAAGAIGDLQSLSVLDVLEIVGSSLDDAVLTQISKLRNLSKLTLDRTGLDDDGIQKLVGMQHLRSLSLRDTNLTDRAVESLKSLQNLEWLDVQYAGVTGDGRALLRKALPNCYVYPDN